MRAVPLLLLCAACAGPPPPASTFYARAVEPCGLATLEIAQRPDGPFLLVAARGEASPVGRLRYHAFLELHARVSGELTGRLVEDAECGFLPELHVDGFTPWGQVSRVFSRDALDGQLHVYTEPLPRDRFAPEDFEGGPEPALLDADSCRPRAGLCPARTVAQTDATGGALCCARL